MGGVDEAGTGGTDAEPVDALGAGVGPQSRAATGKIGYGVVILQINAEQVTLEAIVIVQEREEDIMPVR